MWQGIYKTWRKHQKQQKKHTEKNINMHIVINYLSIFSVTQNILEFF